MAKLDDMVLLTEQEIYQRLTQRSWSYSNGELTQDFRFAHFQAAMTFVNQVAEVAERCNHHPNILVHDWCYVRLSVSTHSAGGVTVADFELADQIDLLAS